MGAIMSKRKSIVSKFGDFRSDQPSAEGKPVGEVKDGQQKTSRVAAGIIGTTQRTLTQIREERDALLEQASNSNQVVSLDPDVIDPSPFRDRLPDDSDTDFQGFKNSIAQEGQKVPVTVRRHPGTSDRFQVVYGHRRWRALKELGNKVSAIVADYSDRDLVIAQGIENANRQDLSWIERALFADEMQSAGIKPRDVKAALSIDDAELSKLRGVLKVVPKNLVELIGRAPSIGRPRWLELSAAVKNKSDLSKIEETLSADKVSNASSDDRFLQVLAAVITSPNHEPKTNVQASLELDDVGSMTVTSRSVKIKLANKHGAGFSKFLEAEMASLVERYKSSLEEQ